MNLLQEGQMMTKVAMTILTDSTSAKAIATRMGVTKLTKHIQLRFLYMQDLVANNIIKVKKVGTKENPADVMTKAVATVVLHYHLTNIGLKTNYLDTGVNVNMITTRAMSRRHGIIVGTHYEQAHHMQGCVHDRPKVLHTSANSFAV